MRVFTEEVPVVLRVLRHYITRQRARLGALTDQEQSDLRWVVGVIKNLCPPPIHWRQGGEAVCGKAAEDDTLSSIVTIVNCKACNRAITKSIRSTISEFYALTQEAE